MLRRVIACKVVRRCVGQHVTNMKSNVSLSMGSAQLLALGPCELKSSRGRTEKRITHLCAQSLFI